MLPKLTLLLSSICCVRRGERAGGSRTTLSLGVERRDGVVHRRRQACARALSRRGRADRCQLAGWLRPLHADGSGRHGGVRGASERTPRDAACGERPRPGSGGGGRGRGRRSARSVVQTAAHASGVSVRCRTARSIRATTARRSRIQRDAVAAGRSERPESGRDRVQKHIHVPGQPITQTMTVTRQGDRVLSVTAAQPIRYHTMEFGELSDYENELSPAESAGSTRAERARPPQNAPTPASSPPNRPLPASRRRSCGPGSVLLGVGVLRRRLPAYRCSAPRGRRRRRRCRPARPGSRRRRPDSPGRRRCR